MQEGQATANAEAFNASTAAVAAVKEEAGKADSLARPQAAKDIIELLLKAQCDLPGSLPLELRGPPAEDILAGPDDEKIEQFEEEPERGREAKQRRANHGA